MSTTTLLAHQPVAPVPAPQIAPLVWLLHTWDSHHDESDLYIGYQDALHTLATSVRRDWSDHNWRSNLPSTPDGLSDATVVCLRYGRDVEECPATGEHLDAGFEITEQPVHGQAPDLVPLRSAALHIVDEHPDDQQRPLLYRIDALGLRIAVTAGTHGPVVALTNGALAPGTAVTVTAEDFEEWSA